MEWFRSRSHPLKTATPTGDDSDLSWLDDLARDARVVSLGEASHGTSEFFTLKHRFVRYLVEHHGFTEFSIEANFAGCRVVDEWVQGAGPDTEEAANIALAHTSYHTWDTVEVLEMIRWMRAYNEGRPEEQRVHFHGFDLGGSALAVRQYIDYVERVDPNAAEEKLAALGPIARGESTDREGLAKALEAAIAELDENRVPYVEASSPREFGLTQLGLADALRGFRQTRSSAAGDSMSHRDLAMADNCAALLEAAGPGRKLIVWAHNAHVARQTMEVPATIDLAPPADDAEREPPVFATVKSQGWHLAERFGREQRVIGFALGGGRVKMWDLHGDRTLKDREFGPPPEDTLDAALAQLGEPIVAVDVRNPPADGEVSEWLRAPRRSRSITAGWFGEISEFFNGRNWLDAYDVVVYVEKSTGVTYNPTVVMTFGEMGGATEPAPAPTNLDFEHGVDGWVIQGDGDRLGAYSATATKGVLTIERTDSGFRTGMGGLSQQVNAEAYRGQRVTLEAEVRARTAGRFDRAVLFLSDASGFEPSEDAAEDWSTLRASVEVGTEATRLIFGLRLNGNGTAEFRNLSLTTDGSGSS